MTNISNLHRGFKLEEYALSGLPLRFDQIKHDLSYAPSVWTFRCGVEQGGRHCGFIVVGSARKRAERLRLRAELRRVSNQEKDGDAR